MNTEQAPKKLRDYEGKEKQYIFYAEQHRNQTYDYVINKLSQYDNLDNKSMTMQKALLLMDLFVDPSDPDVSGANSIHAYQTAERVRKEYPDDHQLQICGLKHDIGKVLFTLDEPSWAVVGDTYAVGCKFPESIVYYETMKENPDWDHPVYSTQYGIYEPNCGIEKLYLSFGHDEYLYRVLQKNKTHLIGHEYQQLIRFHSFYPWHTGNEYGHLEKDSDSELKKRILAFNKYDLYSKEDTDFKLTSEIRKYYKELLARFFPEPLVW